MAQVTRRRFVGSAAAAGLATAITGRSVGAASSRWSSPAVIRAQNAPVEIVFANIWGTPPGGDEPEKQHPVMNVIDAFNEQSDDVKVIGRTDSGVYLEVLQKAQAEMAAGNPPALVTTPWANIHYAYEGLGVVALEDVGGDEFDEVFGQLDNMVLPLVQIDGKTIGLPYAFSCPVFYYNADLFKDAGVDPDEFFESWASIGELGPKISEALDGNPIFGEITNSDWPAQSIVQSNGGFILDDNNAPVMDSPEAVAAMQAIADLDNAGLYDRSMSSERRQSFIGGSIAGIMGSIASLGGLKNQVDFDLQTSTFPVFEGKDRKMSSGGSFIGMYAQDEEQQQAAWEFLKFALTEDAYALWMETGYLNPTTHDLPVLEGQEAAYTQLEEGLTRETAWPTGRGGELQSTWEDYVQRIWANDIDSEEGCNQAADELQAIIDSAS